MNKKGEFRRLRNLCASFHSDYEFLASGFQVTLASKSDDAVCWQNSAHIS